MLFFRVDFILFVEITDKLHTEEAPFESKTRCAAALGVYRSHHAISTHRPTLKLFSLDVEGSEGTEWMGIKIPPRRDPQGS